MRLSTAIGRFGTQLRADGRSQHTRGAYLRDLSNLRAWLRKDIGIRVITANTLARYLTSEGLVGKPSISLNRTKTALRAFFKFLTDAGYLRTNPAKLVKNGRSRPKPPEYFKPAEARRFLEAIPTNDGPAARRDRIMFTLMLQTGIRLGALVRLRVSDIRFDDRVLRINNKGGDERSVYLTSRVRRSLKSYIERINQRPDGPLFPSRNGGPLGRRQVQLRFHNWLKKAGIKRRLTVHSLRHTFAMNLYRTTGDLRLVQAALGHRHISTTEIYARVEDRALQRALEKL
jgi:site-specific recombinase XerD